MTTKYYSHSAVIVVQSLEETLSTDTTWGTYAQFRHLV